VRISGTDAAAARLAARGEDIEYELFGEVFAFPPVMPMDMLLDGLEFAGTVDEWDAWVLRTACGDDAPDRLAKLRTPDGARLPADELRHMIAAVMNAWAVDEGESHGSADSSETAGPASPLTSPSEDETPTTSGVPATSAS
jgi:hypothetical protein